ncbi:MAG: sulfite exporter TauE/SafE family protein [Lachnospiraceae bacterium]|nr:sulfite exporter TauE/SafE family protein [Lachnospiraceae bacterium]
MNLILFQIIIFIGFGIQALTGFGGSMIAMPLCIAVAGVEISKPVITAMALYTAVLVGFEQRKNINQKEMLKISVVMLVWMAVGVWLYKIVPMDFLKIIYGIIVVCIGLKKLLLPDMKNVPKSVMLLALSAAGIMQGMFISGGCFLVIYAVGVLKDKQEFRGTISSVWCILDIVLLISYYFDHSFTAPALTQTLIAIIPATLATFIGALIARKIKQQTFLFISYILLVISGIVLLLTSF